MRIEDLRQYINTGREIEFTYNKKNYSITYYNDDRENYISFCEFYKETSDVSNVDELLNVTRDGKTVQEMIESLSDDDYSVY